MDTSQEKLTLVKGLEGIPCANSAISFINGVAGKLYYRGYTVEDLAQGATFEEVVYILLEGELPTADALTTFSGELASERDLEPEMLDMLRALPAAGHPMDVLQASVAAMGMFHETLDLKDAAVQRKAVCRLVARLPTIAATFSRLRAGLEPVKSNPDLGHAANFLYMLSGETPNPVAARVMDACLVLHAEHTMNASTFAARAVASTMADPYAVISSAIGSLSGPLHGGANERVLNLLDEVGSVARVADVIGGKIDRKDKIMGLGHRVYKTKDPRAKVLQGLARDLFQELGSDERYEVAQAIEALATERLGHKGIYPNVDFYSGIVYSRMGIDRDLFTPIFAISRVSGWLAHWCSQLEDNRIFRPTQIYVGPDARTFIPLAAR